MSAPEARIPAKVLIVRLGALGDVTNALACAGALRRARPDVQIGWAVHELARPLVSDHPWVDRVHLWKKADGLEGMRQVIAGVRAVRYDAVLDLQRILKSAVVARLSGARRVVGYDRGRCKEFAWLLHSERIAPGDPRAPMVQQALDFARHLGVAIDEPERELPLDRSAEAWAEGLVNKLGAAPIALNVGASKHENRWVPERFAELADRLASRERPVLLTGGPDDREWAAAAIAGAKAASVYDLVGKTDLPKLVALYRRIAFYVGCDTGPLHIAAALDRSCVALFGPADPARTGPYGRDHRIVRAPEVDGRRTMASIDVDSVAAACEEVAAASR